MSRDFIFKGAQCGLMVGLLLVAISSPGVFGVAAGSLLVLNGLALYRVPAAPARWILSAGTIVLLPLSAEAAGVGWLALLGVLALPGLVDGLRGFAASQAHSPPRELRTTVAEREAGGPFSFFARRRLTTVFYTLALTGLVAMGLGIVAGRWTLVVTGILFLAWLVGMVGYILLRVPSNFVAVERIRVRQVAGTRKEVVTGCRQIGRLPCMLHLHSPLPWAEVRPKAATLNGATDATVLLSLSLAPPLAGPSRFVLDALAIDPWGLTWTRQRVDAADLHIIPRARYAAWLAGRYLERTRPGSTAAMGSRVSLRRGLCGRLEYHGARPYAPGDSLRDIDWKHTLKLRKLVAKDLGAVVGEGAILVVDLEAPDAESADRLAYHFIMSVLALAQEGIPIVLAGYTSVGVTKVTNALGSREAVRQALELIQQLVRVGSMRRTLAPPVLGRLRRMHRLLEGAGTSPGLTGFLALEIRAVASNAAAHPATMAVREAVARIRPPAAVLALSATPDSNVALNVTLEQLELHGYRAVSLWN
jgi:uncharacterized protein (DUF58 family)